MEESSCPQLLDLMSGQREWRMKDGGGGGGGGGYGDEEDEKLELKLGPPVQEDNNINSSPIFSLGYSSKSSKTNITNLSSGAKRGFFDTLHGYQKQPDGEKKEGESIKGNIPANHNSNHSRTRATPVVGWPPVRSIRKNIASSSSRQSSKDEVLETTKKPEKCTKAMFVKINMDGIPIGRKINLQAYDSYENLSTAVDNLFRGLLAAQSKSAVVGSENADDNPSITGLLDGKGEYTLVYEDNDGDRMLVGDVPFVMFLSTAKRLRVLKTSELYAFIPRSK